MDGFLVINKPTGWVSRRVVDQAQDWFPKTKIGHAGTLDPLATGVLVLCIGAATRLTEYVQRMSKTYAVRVRLGATSDTDDAAGAIAVWQDPQMPSDRQVRLALDSFVGEIDQVPPSHSAARVKGKRAYELAREGRAVALEPRTVRIDRLEMVRFQYPALELIVDCGKGTYVRSLARDLGERLGCGGLVEALERTRIGAFRVEDAISPETDRDTAKSQLLPVEAAMADLPSVTLQAGDLGRLKLGTRINVRPVIAGNDSGTSEVAVLDEHGKLAVIGIWDEEGKTLQPHRVIRREIEG